MYWDKKNPPPFGTLQVIRKFCFFPTSWGKKVVWLSFIPMVKVYESDAKYSDWGREAGWSTYSMKDFLTKFQRFVNSIYYEQQLEQKNSSDLHAKVQSLVKKEFPNWDHYFTLVWNDSFENPKIPLVHLSAMALPDYLLRKMVKNPVEGLPYFHCGEFLTLH